MFDLQNLVRKNIMQMKPYSSARHEFTGNGKIFLDANENAFGSPLAENYNRYPDPLQVNLKEKISEFKSVPVENIFLGNGSDEAIDLLFRIFCAPGRDEVILLPPTYGMYQVCAEMNDVAIRNIPLTTDFQIDMKAVISAIDSSVKIIFICSPNNPTGNTINKTDIESLLKQFNGLVVIDEAYIDYASTASFTSELENYPNLVILQTFSKAWGLAGLRLGMALAYKEIIALFNKVKYPYNINQVTQELALEAFENRSLVQDWISITLDQRKWLENELMNFSFTELVYTSASNFLLVKMKEAKKIYDHLCRNEIIVRDRSNIILCNDCLRITVGAPDQNIELIDSLKKYPA